MTYHICARRLLTQVTDEMRIGNGDQSKLLHRSDTVRQIPIPSPRIVADCQVSDSEQVLPAEIEWKTVPSAGPTSNSFDSGPQHIALVDQDIRYTLWPEPDNTTSGGLGSTLFCIADTGQSGLGMFSTDSIQTGELIVQEKPLIIYPQLLPFHRELPADNAYLELAGAIESLSLSSREAFFLLMNSHPQEPSRIKAIIDTNALHIGLLPHSKRQYAAVCKDISRVNHRSALFASP